VCSIFRTYGFDVLFHWVRCWGTLALLSQSDLDWKFAYSYICVSNRPTGELRGLGRWEQKVCTHRLGFLAVPENGQTHTTHKPHHTHAHVVKICIYINMWLRSVSI
jgi:hypothetical protein